MTNHRRLFSRLFSGLLLLVALAPAAMAGMPGHRPGELLVKYRDAAAAGKAVARVAGAVTHGRHMGGVLHRLRLPAGVSVAEAVERYRRDPDVVYAEPNYIVRKAIVPNDPRFDEQWAASVISLPLAWNTTTGDTATIIAIVDTGIDYEHPDLAANMWQNTLEASGVVGVDDDGNGFVDDVYGYSFNGAQDSADPMDDDTADAHGTHVAGIAGAEGNNGEGVSGVNWRTRLMAVKVLHGPTGDGSVADVAEGVRYAVDNGARVLNLSLTLPGYSQTLADAIDYADSQGALVVVAAGNSAYDLDWRNVSPPSLRRPNLIGVAAIDQSARLAYYSNYGHTTVDVAAPGGTDSLTSNAILSTVSPIAGRGLYHSLAGTSMAAPHVAGLAALLWSAFPDLDHHAIKGRILNGSVPLAGLEGRLITGGRIDAYRSLTQAERPAVFDVLPTRLPAGGVVTVHGVNFGSTEGSVSLDGEAMAVQRWDSDGRLLEAKTPPCGESGNVQVNGDGSGFFVSLEQLPEVSIAPPEPLADTPYTLRLLAQASDPNGQIVSYEWDTGSGEYAAPQSDNSTVNSYSMPGSYTVRVRVIDNCGYVASAERVVTIEGDTVSDSRCFIATAAWGSSLHPRVQVLRDFRDRYLMRSAAGRALVEAYYRVSPALADIIRRSPLLREMSVALLTPVVAAAEWQMALSGQPADDTEVETTAPQADYVPGELLLKFHEGVDEARRTQLLAEQGATVIRHSASGVYHLRLPEGSDTLRIIDWFVAQPEVAFAEPNHRVRKMGGAVR